jgi:predicted nucleotidyltransferase
MTHHINIVRIKAVAQALNSLNSKVVFVGGASVSLYANRPVIEIRPTDDVDVILEILNYNERIILEERLREIGFVNDIDSGIICRYIIRGIIVDILPTNDPSIGFANRWYPEGFEQSVLYNIDELCSINILHPAYFIATKMEAFKGRGQFDGRTSRDFEDIIFVLENRTIVWDELNTSEGDIRIYLQQEFKNWMNQKHINEWIDAHVERGYPSATELIIEQIKKFIDGGS